MKKAVLVCGILVALTAGQANACVYRCMSQKTAVPITEPVDMACSWQRGCKWL